MAAPLFPDKQLYPKLDIPELPTPTVGMQTQTAYAPARQRAAFRLISPTQACRGQMLGQHACTSRCRQMVPAGVTAVAVPARLVSQPALSRDYCGASTPFHSVCFSHWIGACGQLLPRLVRCGYGRWLRRGAPTIPGIPNWKYQRRQSFTVGANSGADTA